MSDFSINSKDIIDYTLKLQRINDVALPIATQNALNSVVKDTKKRTLNQVTNRMFDVQKKTFFNSHSAFKPYKAKQFNYNINKLKADVMITKGNNPKETAAEQVANQPTASPIDRSINPLGNKPQKKSVIDVLKKKPEFADVKGIGFAGEGDPKAMYNYIRGAARAHKRGAPLVLSKRSKRTGQVYKVKTMRRRKPTKNNPSRYKIALQKIASYSKGGKVNLRKRAPFLSNALDKSASEIMKQEFYKQAEKQIARALK